MEFIYYNIVNDYFVKLHKVDVNQLEKLNRVEELAEFNKKIIKAELLFEYISLGDNDRAISKNTHYYIIYENKLFAALQVPRIYIFKEFINTFEYKAKYLAEKFRRETRQTLLSYLPNEDEANIDKTLKALMNYTFSDEYSFWLYNPYAKQYHLFNASFYSEVEHVSEDDKRHTLKQFMDEVGESSYCHRTIKDDVVNTNRLIGMRYINRIKICSKDNTDFKVEGILTFYSKYDDFVFNPEMVCIIKKTVELKLAAYMSCYLTDYSSSIMRLTEFYKLGGLIDSLQRFTDYLAEKLHYEAVSIWFMDDNKLSLNLVALTEAEGRDVSKEPILPYELAVPSLTVTAFKQNNVICSYDIDNEENNSRHFNERTISSPKNWIAIPISVNYGVKKQAVGVLRVKNKFKKCDGRNEIATIDKLDIDMLRNITADIAYLKQIDDNFIFKQNEANNKLLISREESQKANDFIKTFRHELKSPLTTLTLASEDIKNTLLELGLISGTSDKIIPKKLRETLDDLSAVGIRLAFVTNYLTFDAQGLIKNIEETHIFKDVVAPVLQFAEPYARKRHKRINVNKDSILSLPKVNCDSNASAVVFNILIDNAIKYANRGSEINVYGKITGSGNACVIVENIGFNILEEEKDTIFNKYTRGEMAIKQKTEGSGIGLYLAKEIMKLNNGNITLSQLRNPVKFELQINKEKKR